LDLVKTLGKSPGNVCSQFGCSNKYAYILKIQTSQTFVTMKLMPWILQMKQHAPERACSQIAVIRFNIYKLHPTAM
jgi:hypothetical protein